MRINWQNVLEQVLAVMGATALLALLGLLLAPVRRWYGRLWPPIVRMAKQVFKFWPEILAAILLGALYLLVFIIYRDIRAVGLMIAFTGALLLALRLGFRSLLWRAGLQVLIGKLSVRVDKLEETLASPDSGPSYQTISIDDIANGRDLRRM